MTLLTFRDAIRTISPPWLQTGVAEKVLYALALHIDGLIDGVTAGVKSRFPNVYSAESLPLIGRERRILRGRTETDTVYASRLTRWLDDHKGRGGPVALLTQLNAHFAPSSFPMHVVYYSGREFSADAAGVVTRELVDVDWAPDANTAKWARWWLFYEWPTAIGDDGLWGDAGTYGDGGVWGSDLLVEDVVDLRAVPREWNAAHTIGVLVLLPAGAELWGYPEGTWGDGEATWGEADPVNIGIG